MLLVILVVFTQCKKSPLPAIVPGNPPVTTPVTPPVVTPVTPVNTPVDTLKTLVGWWTTSDITTPVIDGSPTIYMANDGFFLSDRSNGVHWGLGKWQFIKDSLDITQHKGNYFFTHDRFAIQKLTADTLQVTDKGKHTTVFHRVNLPAISSKPLNTVVDIPSGGLGAMTMDKDGNIYYVTDGNLYKLSPDGTIINTAIKDFFYEGFNQYSSFSIDGKGNIYYVYFNSGIKKISLTDKTVSIYNRVAGADLGLLTTNKQGEIYFCTSEGYIKKIDLNNNITIIAGKGNYTRTYSGDGGLAVNATIAPVGAITTDSQGNIYFGDIFGCIRKITVSTGIITTVAGNGTLGNTGEGGLATAASISFIGGIFVNSNGDIFLICGVSMIKKITASTGIITTIAGYEADWNINTSSGSFGYAGPAEHATATSVRAKSIVADASGNVYVTNVVDHIGATANYFALCKIDGN